MNYSQNMERSKSYHLMINQINCSLVQKELMHNVNVKIHFFTRYLKKQWLQFRKPQKCTLCNRDLKFKYKPEKSWHIHLNLDNVKTAKFVTEIRESGMNGYSVRFLDSNGNIAMRANFVKMYDENGNLRSTNLSRYDELFTKYGKKQVISFND